jgi:hypothetical protein
MNLTELAHVAVQEGYELPLDYLVSMQSQGVIIDEFISKIEGGFSVEEYVDQIEMYGA